MIVKIENYELLGSVPTYVGLFLPFMRSIVLGEYVETTFLLAYLKRYTLLMTETMVLCIEQKNFRKKKWNLMKDWYENIYYLQPENQSRTRSQYVNGGWISSYFHCDSKLIPYS